MDDGLEFGRSLSSPGVIFGSGNLDGSFSKSTSGNGIELGLRGKLRFGGGQCAPDNTFNRVGNAGYNFPAGSCNGGNDMAATWSYEFAINSDVGCDSVADGAECVPLNAYDYHISLDQDRSYCTDSNWTVTLPLPTGGSIDLPGTGDPVNTIFDTVKPGNALGTASTKQGGGGLPQCGDRSLEWMCDAGSSACNVATDAGVEGLMQGGCLRNSTTTYEEGIGSLTVAQNSAQLSFFGGPPDYDIADTGIYTIKLAAKCKGTDLVITETYIDVLVGNLATDFPTEASACEGGNFSFDGLFASEEECKDFVSRYA